MRNKSRIPLFLKDLDDVWSDNYDLRFGQLISILFDQCPYDPFFIEDDDMLKIINNYFKEEKKNSREIKIGKQYKHFKGSTATVISVVKHSETNEDLVVYSCVGHPGEEHKDGLYARPLKMFLSEVDHEKYPNVKQKYRFEEI